MENAGGERMVVEASAGLSVRKDAESEHGVDPHLWLDPNNVIRYVENIRDGLAEFDPEGAGYLQIQCRCLHRPIAGGLDVWIREQVNSIPAERRLLVTNHDSLGYFAERYGFTVIGTVVQGTSSNAAPSAQQMAALIDQIKAIWRASRFSGCG